MKSLEFYYWLKPIIPRRLQIAVRRAIASHKRRAYFDIWPINPNAAASPKDWMGWPDGKKFALILSHDVDTVKGHDSCIKLMEIEEKKKFRSSFNFVPEGYPVSGELLRTLRDKGFDIGVHGLTHDGRLFTSKKRFLQSVPKINCYIRAWGAAGFQSPSMLSHFEWISELEVEYDCSTFDADPFEPNDSSVKTIFPFMLIDKLKARFFVEIPYTLPQDHTLFVILKDKNINTWKKKVDWIVEKGGMVFLNTHPDYINFDDSINSLEEYSKCYYEEFLDYISERYAGLYWHVLPRELALFWREKMYNQINVGEESVSPIIASLQSNKSNAIWIDLDNSPHVPFFRPVIKELENRGYRILITARDNSQTCSLADNYLLNYIRVGKHYGKNKILKVLGTISRAVHLVVLMRNKRLQLAIGHGSRAQALAARLLSIPSLSLYDYEFTAGFNKPTWQMSPEIIDIPDSSANKSRQLKYPGIKEDVYVPFFKPNFKLRESLGIGEEDILITLRPPATEAHYHNPESELLFDTAVNQLKLIDSAKLIILPRYQAQTNHISRIWPEEIKSGKIIMPEGAIDGLNLLWNSDLVISGGGTMNREAAALRVPVYSIFRGKIGAVDRWLSKQGRLVLIESVRDIHEKIRVVKRKIGSKNGDSYSETLLVVIKHIENLITNTGKIGKKRNE